MGLLGAIVLILGSLILFIFSQRAYRQTEPYRLALETVRQAESVQDRFGQPIEEVWAIDNQVEIDEATGQAHLQFEVSGSKYPALVTARARKVGEQWELTYLEVKGTTIFTEIVLIGGLQRLGRGQDAPP